MLVLLLLFLTLTEGVKLPPTFKKCNRKQPDLKQCVHEAAQNGMSQLTKPFKEIDTPTLDPLEIPKMTIKGGTGTVAIDQNFKNCKMYGFDKTQFDKFEFDFDAKILAIDANFSKIVIKCEYQMDGKILFLPVRGQGPCTIIFQNLTSTALHSYEEIMKNGKTYLKFLSSKVDMDPGFMSFSYENLFDGDKQLGDNINKSMNENWKEVFEDVKSDFVELIGQIARGLFQKFFNKVSMEEAFDD